MAKIVARVYDRWRKRFASASMPPEEALALRDTMNFMNSDVLPNEKHWCIFHSRGCTCNVRYVVKYVDNRSKHGKNQNETTGAGRTADARGDRKSVR